MRDMYHDMKTEISLNMQALTAAANGDAIIDLQGFQGARIEISSGTITDGTSYEFELKEGNDSGLSDVAAVVDADLIGSEPTFLVADDNKIKTFSYVGTKRYLRIDLKTVVGSPSTGGLFEGRVIKGHPRHKPAQT
jgi:hypothetical protein